jgi:GGDEF domain-containing protein
VSLADEAGRSKAEEVVRAAFWSTYLLGVVATVFVVRGGEVPVLGLEAPGGWRFGLLWYAVVAPVSAFAASGLAFVASVRGRRSRPTAATRVTPMHAGALRRHRRRSDGDLGWVHDALAESAAAKARVGAQGLVDPLTGLLSRDGLLTALPDLSPPYAVTLVTLDRFTHIIEHDGHLAAERALCDVAAVLRRGRAEDLVARWEDCELMLVLPGTTAADGTARVRRLLADAHATVRVNGRPLGISAAISDAAPDVTFAAAVAQAERAMSSAEPRLIVVG